ncbi:MAG: hypothetical protein KF901_13550 [Myxococcales bacterium]|nr:hypothetical protein [Myxococcales bacterium]
MSPTVRWAVLAAVVLFVAFLVLKSRLAFARTPHAVEGRKKLAACRQRARAASTASEKAAAWREAATIALDELERPNLAASFARRAERIEPTSDEGLSLLSRTMRRAQRPQALAKLLWRRLAEEPLDSPRADRLMAELLSLYDGPLRRPAKAKVLRELWGRARSDAGTRADA